MNIGVDLDDTITANVVFYRKMMELWHQSSGKVYIVTGRSPVDKNITLAELKHWGIRKGIHYDELLMFPGPYLWSRHINGGHYMKVNGDPIDKETISRWIGYWKAKTCAEHGISIFYDDNNTFVDEMRQRGIYVLHADGKFKDTHKLLDERAKSWHHGLAVKVPVKG